MKKAILIYGPTPIFGGKIGANKQDLVSAIFGVGNNKKLVKAVQTKIKEEGLLWEFDFDSTESDPEAILKQDNALIVILPTLEMTFDKSILPQDQLLQLSSLEYHQNDISRIIAFMKNN